MNGQFDQGGISFDVNDLTYPTIPAYSNADYSAETVEDLAEFIAAEMNKFGSCGISCAEHVAAYIWSYRADPGENINIQNLAFTESGLTLDLSCAQGAETVLVKVLDPAASPDAAGAGLTAFTSRADGLKTVDLNSIATVEDNGEIALVGDGHNIWEDEVWFNAIAEEFEDGKLDITLNIDSVINVEHQFAKVGILVSSTDDLSGQLLLLHWSGFNGLAEDSGTAGLTGYSQLLANPEAEALTPTPTTLRVVYESDALQVGGCYNCDSPTMKPAARDVNFVPRRAFIVASSHDGPTILANVSVVNPHRPGSALYETRMACGAEPISVKVSEFSLSAYSTLKLAVYSSSGDELLTERTTDKTWSASASCELSDGLLAPKLRRLSEQQVMNSLRDIFGDIFSEDLRPNMEDGAKLIGMNTMADRLNINTINLERLYDSSRDLVSVILQRNSTVSECANNTSSANCVTSLLEDFGLQLWRRPMTAEELGELTDQLKQFNTNKSALEFALNSMILSSHFLFRSEMGTEKSGIRMLDNYEIVTLLAYTIWNSTPDQALLTLAQKTSPLTTTELQAQVDRMFASPKAEAALVEIYKDYLKLEMGLTNEKADELGFTDAVRAELMRSAELMLADQIAAGETYMDVFSGNRFYVSRSVQSFFNVTGAGDQLQATSISESERYGILNHPLFLATHSTLAHSGIIKRGVFTLEQMMCEPLGPPPTDVDSLGTQTDLDPATTSERILLQAMHSAQPACVGCHKYIDPAGFGFEHFDAVGRYRTVEKEVVQIDASGILETAAGTKLVYSNSAEYAEQLTGSTQMRSCVSRRFLEHYLSQELSANACELRKYQEQLDTREHTVKSLLDSLIQLESFTKRKQVQ